jgi:tetrahydromethanopterin S-methyltransferase subunit B
MTVGLGTLAINIGGKTAQFEKDLGKAYRLADRETKRAARKIEQNISRAFKTIGAVAITAVGGMTTLVKSTIDTADNLEKLTRRLGISAEGFSKLAFAAEGANVPVKSLEVGLQRMTRRLNEVASTGKGTAAKALEALGVEAKELAALAPEDQFLEIARAMEGIPQQGERVRLAFSLFDTEGVKLLQLMNDGVAGIEAAMNQAEEFGAVISGDVARQSAQFNQEITNLKAQFQGVVITLTGKLLPTFNEFLTRLRESDAVTKFANGIAVVVENLDLIIGAFTALIAGKLLAAVITGFRNLTTTAKALSLVLKTMGGPLSLIIGLAASLGGALYAASDNINVYTEAVESATTAQQEFTQAIAQNDIVTAVSAQTRLIESMKVQVAELEKTIEGLSRQSERITGGAIRDMEREIKSLNAEIDKEVKVLEELKQQLEDTTPSIEEVGGVVGTTGEQVDKLTESAKALIESLSESERELQTIKRAYQILTEQFEAGEITLGDYIAKVTALDEVYGELAPATEEVTEATESMLEQFEAGIQAVDTLGETMENSARQGLEGFDNFLRAVPSKYTSAISEMLRSSEGLQETLGGLFGNNQGAAELFGALGQGAQLGGIAGGITGGNPLGSTIGGAIGGALGSTFGPLGTAIGSLIGGALGGLVGTDSDRVPRDSELVFGSDAIDAFGRGGRPSIFNNALGLETLIFDRNAAFFEQLQPQAEQLTRTFFSSLAGILDAETERAVVDSLRGRSFNIDVDEVENGKFLEPVLDAIISNLDPRVQVLTSSFDGLEEKMNALGAALTLIEQIDVDPLQEWARLREEAEFSTLQRTQAQADALTDLVMNFDGSIEAMNQLARGTQSFNQSVVQTLASIESVRRAIEQTTEQNIEQLRLRTLGHDERFERLTLQAEALAQQIQSAGTEEEVNRLVEQINALVSQSAGILTDEELAIRFPNIEEFLTSVNQAGQNRLDQIDAEVTSVAEQIGTQFEEQFGIFQDAAGQFTDATGAIVVAGDRFDIGSRRVRKSAELMIRAANTPVTVRWGGAGGEVGV